MLQLHVNTNQAVKSAQALQLVDTNQQQLMLHQLTLISHATRFLLALIFTDRVECEGLKTTCAPTLVYLDTDNCVVVAFI